MNRRHFLSAMGGATAVSVASMMKPNLFAASTTSLYVKGLVLLSFEDPKMLRLGFIKAPGHNSTLSILPQTGAQRVLNISGNGVVESNALGLSAPKMVLPELIRMKELYGEAIRSRLAECPSVISIPTASIRSISTGEISQSRYTFVRADNGQEVTSFRPRQIAESIKIELSSADTLRMDKTSIPLATVREIRAEVSPTASTIASISANGDAFTAHFHHYLMYLDRSKTAKFDVVPKRLGGGPSVSSAKGNSFMYNPWVFCYLAGV